MGLICLASSLWLTGCTLDRSIFQIDSNSRTPQFGLNLVPKKQEEPAFRSISHTAADEQQPQLLSTSHEEPSERSRWTKWWNPLSKPKRIPLPTTESNQDLGEPAEIEPQDALDYGF